MGPSPKTSFQPSRTTFRCGPYSSTPQRLQSAASMAVTYQVPFELPNSHVPLSFRLSSRVVEALESLPPLPPTTPTGAPAWGGRAPPPGPFDPPQAAPAAAARAASARADANRSPPPQISPPDHRLAAISSIPPVPTGEVRQGLRQ